MTSLIVSGLLGLAGVLFAAHGLRRLRRGLRHGRSLELARGLRSCVSALALGVFATGILTGLHGLLVLGAVFLAEELYETGLLIAIVRAGERATGTQTAASSPGSK
jgi:hypothetical protein